MDDTLWWGEEKTYKNVWSYVQGGVSQQQVVEKNEFADTKICEDVEKSTVRNNK